MQYRKTIFTSASLIASSLAAYVPSEPWSTLTPDSSAPTGAVTDYTQTFGIAVVPLPTTTADPKVRREVGQIGDGQIQNPTTTPKAPAQPISQIGDGQIQATTATPKPTAQPISQIGDGQIQATTATPKPTAQPISQIGDGQIQATTATPKSTAQPISQIGDGQIQATTSTTSVASQIGDGQVQATTTTLKPSSAESSPAPEATGLHDSVACLTDSSLAMVLKEGILTDAAGRIGSIVANRQFQFDGPPPQAGAIYAAGWSVTKEGNLAIGSNDVFYQCLSGTFYNLYDENVAAQCTPIHLEVVDLVKC